MTFLFNSLLNICSTASPSPPTGSMPSKPAFLPAPTWRPKGFIHSSEQHQILETARRYYAGRADLVLLEWDEAALAAAGVRVEREWVASRQQHFAHVFGPVPLAAVRRSWPFGADADG